MEYGYIPSKPTWKDYKQNGRLQLGGSALQPNGQWDTFLPAEELQAQYTETQACASFGTLNCVEALERHEFGKTNNWSDRFLAKISGTSRQGNDPHTVAETLRKKGTVPEAEWPTKEVYSWDDFYKDIPFQVQVDAQAKFRGLYEFAHQYVKTDPNSMMTALQFSPLGADVFAWSLPDGRGHYRRSGRQSNHWVCIYGFVEGRYWKCFDTYDNTHKKLVWDFGFTVVKQYTLHKTVLKTDLWSLAIKWLRERLGL